MPLPERRQSRTVLERRVRRRNQALQGACAARRQSLTGCDPEQSPARVVPDLAMNRSHGASPFEPQRGAELRPGPGESAVLKVGAAESDYQETADRSLIQTAVQIGTGGRR